jgi:hypothetical protein
MKSSTPDSTAVLSEDGTYRYELTRRLQPGFGGWSCTFIMLNPSTADALEDDRTIRRCKSFALGWGYPWLRVVNLFAYRTPYPRDLVDAMEAGVDIVGPENDFYIDYLAEKTGKIVAAWGAHELALRRGAEVMERMRRHDLAVHCLGTTKSGAPRHPLYLKGDTELERYRD